jgi:hypothetical protein
MDVFVAYKNQLFPVEVDTKTTSKQLLSELGLSNDLQLRTREGEVLRTDEPVAATLNDGEKLYVTPPINVAEEIA